MNIRIRINVKHQVRKSNRTHDYDGVAISCMEIAIKTGISIFAIISSRKMIAFRANSLLLHLSLESIMRISISIPSVSVVQNPLLCCHACSPNAYDVRQIHYSISQSHLITSSAQLPANAWKNHILFFAVELVTLLTESNVRFALNLILMWPYVYMQINSFS